MLEKQGYGEKRESRNAELFHDGATVREGSLAASRLHQCLAKERRTEKTEGLFCPQESVPVCSSLCARALLRKVVMRGRQGLLCSFFPGLLQECVCYIGRTVHPGEFRTIDAACVEEEFGHGAEPLLDLARAVRDVKEAELFLQGVVGVGIDVEPC